MRLSAIQDWVDQWPGSQGRNGDIAISGGEAKWRPLKEGDSEQQNDARGGAVTAERFRRAAAPTIGSGVAPRKSPWTKPIKYL